MVHVEGIETPKLQSWLWTKHRVMTTPIMHPEFNGLRVTPSIYTTPREVDLFSELLLSAVKSGIA
jgi:hypothetical protein